MVLQERDAWAVLPSAATLSCWDVSTPTPRAIIRAVSFKNQNISQVQMQICNMHVGITTNGSTQPAREHSQHHRASSLITYLALPFAPVTPLHFFGGFSTFKHLSRCLAHSDPLGTSFSINATNILTRNQRMCAVTSVFSAEEDPRSWIYKKAEIQNYQQYQSFLIHYKQYLNNKITHLPLLGP